MAPMAMTPEGLTLRIVKALLLPFLLILTLIGVDRLHGPRPVPLQVMPATPGR